jgi:hypothetical protein
MLALAFNRAAPPAPISAFSTVKETEHDYHKRSEGSLQADLHLHQLQMWFRLSLRPVRQGGEMLDLPLGGTAKPSPIVAESWSLLGGQ